MRALFLYLIACLVLFACTTENNQTDEPISSESSNDSALIGEYYFDEYIEKLSNEYYNKDIVVAAQFEFTTNDKIMVLETFEVNRFATIFVPEIFDDYSPSLAKGDVCSNKDKSKGRCYDVTCYRSDGTSTTTRCSGTVNCLRTAGECFDEGGCVRACRVPPSLIYLPPAFVEELIEELHEGELLPVRARILLFQGEE